MATLLITEKAPVIDTDSGDTLGVPGATATVEVEVEAPVVGPFDIDLGPAVPK